MSWRNNSDVYQRQRGSSCLKSTCGHHPDKKRCTACMSEQMKGRTMLRNATEHKPWEVKTDLKCFAWKRFFQRAELKETSVERSWTVSMKTPCCREEEHTQLVKSPQCGKNTREKDEVQLSRVPLWHPGVQSLWNELPWSYTTAALVSSGLYENNGVSESYNSNAKSQTWRLEYCTPIIFPCLNIPALFSSLNLIPLIFVD